MSLLCTAAESARSLLDGKQQQKVKLLLQSVLCFFSFVVFTWHSATTWLVAADVDRAVL